MCEEEGEFLGSLPAIARQIWTRKDQKAKVLRPYAKEWLLFEPLNILWIEGNQKYRGKIMERKW